MLGRPTPQHHDRRLKMRISASANPLISTPFPVRRFVRELSAKNGRNHSQCGRALWWRSVQTAVTRQSRVESGRSRRQNARHREIQLSDVGHQVREMRRSRDIRQKPETREIFLSGGSRALWWKHGFSTITPICLVRIRQTRARGARCAGTRPTGPRLLQSDTAGRRYGAKTSTPP